MEAIFKGKVVSEQASRQMIDIMLQTRFAPDLIPALLPRGTPVARKAGTLPTSLNETGIIYLPENKGHLIVTVMHNNMRETRETAARFIAGVARAAYDHFVAVKQD
jgi:beta-lactamase class A